MSRFGINTKDALGVSIPELRKFARRIGTNHETAIRLWKTGVHEARILASFVDDYSAVSEGQMEEWAGDFDSWACATSAAATSLTRPGSPMARRSGGRGGRRSM